MPDEPTSGEVVVLCTPTQSAWSCREEAKTAAVAAGGVLDGRKPPTVLHTGVINDIDLAEHGLKAVVFAMRAVAYGEAR